MEGDQEEGASLCADEHVQAANRRAVLTTCIQVWLLLDNSQLESWESPPSAVHSGRRPEGPPT